MACFTWYSAGADEYAGETMQRLCSAALDFQATMYSLPIRAEYNIHVETLALFSKISTSVARQVAPRPESPACCRFCLQSSLAQSPARLQSERALLQSHSHLHSLV